MYIFNDVYRIVRIDTYNLVIQKKKEVKSEKNGIRLDWKDCGYFPNLESALERLKSKILFDSVGECNTLDEMIKFVSEFKLGIKL